MNRQELFHQARLTIEQRRQTAETTARKRKDEMYAAVPELAQLDREQNLAGIAAACLATDGQGDQAREKLAEARKIGDQKKALLQKLDIQEKDFLPQYSCPICRDTGILKQESSAPVCQCVKEEVKRMRREEINHSGPFAPCRFETFSLDYYPEKIEGETRPVREYMSHLFEFCKSWAEAFSPRSQSIYMYGDAGLGKTHLALSIGREVLEKGYDVIYVSSQSAFANVSARRWEQDELFNSMLDADLLILDDLGSEYLDAYISSRLYELINARLRKPTIYTSNICSAEQLEQRYTEKISSRLLGECNRMQFVGQDIRLQK